MSALNTAGASGGGLRQAQLSIARRGRGSPGLVLARRGGGRRGVQIREQTTNTAPAFRSVSDLISNNVNISSEEEDEDENPFGFGRCFRCGESGSNTILALPYKYSSELMQVNLATGFETVPIRK